MPDRRLAGMAELSRDDVAHVAMLARIALSEEELDRLAGQLDQIVGWVGQVNEVAADDVLPMSHPLPLTNVTRPDEVRPGLTAEQALSGAPLAQDQRFGVPRILDEE
jgi:aspartyl-tRNA(Asn)/glutamyl-tRNA(Gln) amidotransferase subunit C